MNPAGVFVASFVGLWGMLQILIFFGPTIDTAIKASGYGKPIGIALVIGLLLGLPVMICVALAKDKSP